MPKPFHRHKLLLDENMPPRLLFPQTNERFDVKHVNVDLHQGGINDLAVYRLAVREQRIIVSQNWRHFIKLVGTAQDVGVIAVTGKDWARMDSQLASVLTRHAPAHFRGKVLTLNAR
ncbi:DUF5615 family PIN-like protein [Streptomyces sp. NPDC093514]|uniref:DUF5615 family PIN-like protein n=1 Tax=Streptomyces sp. NPDC093514 TaxID=3366039 RepID=UPI0037F1F40A